MKTTYAIKKCSEWLAFCLSIGYSKKDLGQLEKIWWQHHDDKGKLGK